MDFFDKLGKKASEAYKVTADKTGKIAKETKIKLRIGELKNQINDIYEEIGKKVYEKHVREEEICIKKDLEEQCTKIDVLSDEVDGLLKQCLELKDKKQCQKCFKEIEKNAKYCPNCGAKQTEEPKKEVEALEKLEDSEVKEENKKEKEIVIDELEEKAQEDLNTNNDNEEEQSEEINEDAKDDLEKTVEIESNVNLEDEEE